MKYLALSFPFPPSALSRLNFLQGNKAEKLWYVFFLWLSESSGWGTNLGLRTKHHVVDCWTSLFQTARHSTLRGWDDAPCKRGTWDLIYEETYGLRHKPGKARSKDTGRGRAMVLGQGWAFIMQKCVSMHTCIHAWQHKNTGHRACLKQHTSTVLVGNLDTEWPPNLHTMGHHTRSRYLWHLKRFCALTRGLFHQ